MLAIIPLMRRDWRFMLWAAVWSAVLLIALPSALVRVGGDVELYRSMFTEHLLGIVSGAMSHDIASQVSPGAISNIGIGALVARIAAVMRSIQRRCRNGLRRFSSSSTRLR